MDSAAEFNDLYGVSRIFTMHLAGIWNNGISGYNGEAFGCE
jgi:hypothetical protein